MFPHKTLRVVSQDRTRLTTTTGTTTTTTTAVDRRTNHEYQARSKTWTMAALDFHLKPTTTNVAVQVSNNNNNNNNNNHYNFYGVRNTRRTHLPPVVVLPPFLFYFGACRLALTQPSRPGTSRHLPPGKGDGADIFRCSYILSTSNPVLCVFIMSL